MARTGTCKTCGKKIRPRDKDMSVGAASRIHYWKFHPEVIETETVVMRSATGTVRWIRAEHRQLDKFHLD